MNKAKKGQYRERFARKQLEADGWFITFKSIRNRFGCIDYANLFDIVAYKNMGMSYDKPYQLRKFISVKHYGSYRQHKIEIANHRVKYGLVGESYELWQWKSPRWEGRGKDKHYSKGQFVKEVI